MNKRIGIWVVWASSIALGLLFSNRALAQANLCTNNGQACLWWRNSGTNIGIEGDSTGIAGTGLYGQSSNTNGIGVGGYSNQHAGVVGIGKDFGVWGENVSGTAGTAAVYGVGTLGTTGVRGASDTGLGVYASTGHWNAVYGLNSDIDGTAATISAQPGSTSGLAYWGGGNIELMGSHAYKNGTSTWEPISDRRVKRDVKDFDQGIEQLLKVRPVRFHYNGLGGTTDNGEEFTGVIAQELEKPLPTMVKSRLGKLHPGDAKDTEIKYVDPNNFTYMLINAVKEQQKVIERQEERIEALEQGRPPRLSSMMSLGGVETGLMFGLLPVGLVVAVKRRRKQN